MTTEEKYREALDALQTLLNAYGMETKPWQKAREILDRERPLKGSVIPGTHTNVPEGA